LPVIASNVGGVGETIIDGETGFLVPVADAGLWGERLRTLITQTDLRQRFGIQGRQRYLDCFTLTRMTAATLDVYQEVSARPLLL
jgi:glycosyltransferase involved in cell wall biosynthesis